MEAPFTSTTWDTVSGAYYAGFGSIELFWILATLALTVLAVHLGWRHERHAYKTVSKD